MYYEEELQYHIACKKGDVGKYVILPGDPGRCEAIAKHFDDYHHVVYNREFNIFTGTLDGETVSVCSSRFCVLTVISGKNVDCEKCNNA